MEGAADYVVKARLSYRWCQFGNCELNRVKWADLLSVWLWKTALISGFLCGNQSPVLMRKLFQCGHSFFEVHWHFQTSYSFISRSLCSVSPCKGMIARPASITRCIASVLISQTKLYCRWWWGRLLCAALLLQILYHCNVYIRASRAIPLIKWWHMELLK